MFETVMIGSLFFDSAVGTIIDVMTWVVISVILFETINILTKDRFYNKIEKSKYMQPFYGALLGSTPGCSGAIIITSLYNKRKVSLGTLTATFIATFGDAAFVILAGSPQAFLWLVIISIVVAIFMGYLVDFTPLGKKLTVWIDKEDKDKSNTHVGVVSKSKKPGIIFTDIDTVFMPVLFLLLIMIVFPATIINIIDPDWANTTTRWIDVYMTFASWISVIIVVLFISYYFIRGLFLSNKNEDNRKIIEDEDPENCLNGSCGLKIAPSENNTSSGGFNFARLNYETFVNSIFILTWVFFGLFFFEFLFLVFEDQLIAVFGIGGGYAAVLIAIGVGMIPGCGPQIALANFYINGDLGTDTQLIPDSAMAANSINQDGDAEFPLMASEGRTFITLWWLNVIPAFFTGTFLFALETNGIPMPF